MKIVKSIKDITNGIDVNISIDNLNENQIAYLYFPKEMDLSKITFKTPFFVKDLDPLVGFKSKEIGYSNYNGFDSAVLVLIEAPIIYNSDNLIFNYRKSICDNDLGEKYLFSVNKSGSTITNTQLTNFQEEEYNLCVSHYDSSITLNKLRSYELTNSVNDYEIFNLIDSS